MKTLLQLLTILLLLSCSRRESNNDAPPQLIAHAGGAVDSCVYTNSREALEKACEQGYRFIEFDLLFTSDSVLVAAHSWGDFNLMTGFVHYGDSVPTYAEFSKRKIYDRYTPIGASEINAFFESHDSLYLVTDKVSDPNVLQRYFPNLKERMVVEAFNYEHYSRLKSQGYYRVLYSCMADDLSTALLQNASSIEWIALHTSAFDNATFKLITTFLEFNIALFTVDDIELVPEKYRSAVKMLYTNYIQP